MSNITIGIDVSKKTLSIFDPKSSASVTIKNEPDSIKNFLSSIDLSVPIIYEPTWVYSSKLQMLCNSLGHKHFFIHPNDAHHLSKTLHCRNKNDEIDAENLSKLWHMLISQSASFWFKDKLITPSTNKDQLLKTLFSHSLYLKSCIKRDKQHIEVIDNNIFSDEFMKKQVLASIDFHKEQIKTNKKRIITMIIDTWLKEKFELLQSIPWIGEECAIALVIFFRDLTSKWFTKEDSKKVVAYTWLDPSQKQSWSSVTGSSISKKWNKNIRTLLYLSALQRTRDRDKDTNPKKDTVVGKFSNRMYDKFSSKKSKRWRSIICAIWRKLLVTARAIYNTDKAYDFR